LINDKAHAAQASRIPPDTWDPVCMTVTAATLAEPLENAACGFARVLFFGRIADACGRAVTVAIPLDGCSLADLKARIADTVEGGGDALREPGVRVAIDQVMAHDDPWVSPGQEVAFLSAFSGG
jgi:sulfur-carrier protein